MPLDVNSLYIPVIAREEKPLQPHLQLLPLVKLHTELFVKISTPQPGIARITTSADQQSVECLSWSERPYAIFQAANLRTAKRREMQQCCKRKLTIRICRCGLGWGGGLR